MKTKEEIIKELQSDFSGGRIELEGGLLIIEKMYTDKYEIYHNSYIRGGNCLMYTISENEFEIVLQKHQEYLNYRKEIESKGYKLMGKNLFLKERNEKNEIKEAHLEWGKKPYYKEEIK
jgi:hypothetical protein